MQKPGLGGSVFARLRRDKAESAGQLNPNSEVEVECGAAAPGAHAAGVQFSAARRKSRPPNFLAPKSDKEGERRFGRAAPTGTRAAGATILISEFGLNLVSFEKLMAAVGVKVPQSA